MEYQTTDHDKCLLELLKESCEQEGFDGVPRDLPLRSAQALEEYATHRTIAALLLGIKAQGLNVTESQILGAYVDGIQKVPDRGFSSPLNRGKPYRPKYD